MTDLAPTIARLSDHVRSLPADSDARRIARTALADLLDLDRQLRTDVSQVLWMSAS